ncbi:hypothetical protein D3C77_272170 [compost metagenome]
MKLEWIIVSVVLSLSSTANALQGGELLVDTSVKRAIIEPTMVQQAIDLEKQIAAQANMDAPEGKSTVVILKGNRNIIITAPHATEPFRAGKYRFSDGAGTAALADMLNKLSCATVIYTQYRTPSDPNYYDDNEFKNKLAELINTHKPALVLDIHGSHDSRPYDIDFGTMNGKALLTNPSLLTSLMANLRQENIVNFSDNYFAAEKNQTITRFAYTRGVPAIQLEISSTLLRPSEGGMMAHRFAQLLQSLTRYVRDVTSNPSGECDPTF